MSWSLSFLSRKRRFLRIGGERASELQGTPGPQPGHPGRERGWGGGTPGKNTPSSGGDAGARLLGFGTCTKTVTVLLAE